MPGESILSEKGWKDLPSSLQIHILSFLFEYPEDRRPQPIRIFLDFAENITTILPSDLVNVANASLDLDDRVKELLGSRAQYLAADITGDLLYMWVSILGDRVKAVSAFDVNLDAEMQRSIEIDELEDFYSLKGDRALLLFESQQEEAKLHVLDLKDVPPCRPQAWNKYEQIWYERILNSLVGALGQSSESLKELALPMTQLTMEALERVSFDNLQISELELRTWGRKEGMTDAEHETVAEACMHMLQSLDVRDAESQNVTTIRELRLLSIHKAPCVDNTQSNFPNALFNGVTTLRLECFCSRCRGSHQRNSDAMFISLFPNLE